MVGVRSEVGGAVTLVAALAIATPAYADYLPTDFSELVRRAELVVVGTVARVDSQTFELRVESVVNQKDQGRQQADRLEIYKFVDWECAERWMPYERGQRLLMFLVKTKEASKLRKPGYWMAMGAGNEGEMPIQDGYVYMTPDVFPSYDDRVRVFAREFRGTGFPLSYVLQAVRQNEALDKRRRLSPRK